MATTEPARTDAAATAEPVEGYTLDQLSALSGVSARTIRFYRQSGLIDPPRRVGRHAFYAPEQLGRLRFIATLRARGMALDAVGRLLGDPSGSGESFAILLSLQDELLEPWIDDQSAVVDGDEVLRLLGVDERLALQTLLEFGIISPHGDTADSYEVPSVAVLELAAELLAAGIHPEVSGAAWSAMQRRIGDLAEELVTLFAEHPDHGFAGNDTAGEISDAFRQLRPIALRAVQLAFAQEIQRSLGAYVSLAVDADAVVPHRAASPTA